MEPNKVLQTAMQVCSGKKASNGLFATVYPFTTENIAGYINHFDLEGKSLLTVGSSGDQAINAILKGAREVAIIDINIYVKYYYYLKVAAILTLDLNEYTKFFESMFYGVRDWRTGRYTFAVLNEKILNKIMVALKELDYNSFNFWIQLFSKYGSEKIQRALFQYNHRKMKEIEDTCPFLTKKGYSKTKDRIGSIHVTFMNQNILSPNIKGSYDNIWLSNIVSYLKPSEIREAFAQMVPHLNSGGELLFSYIYGNSSYRLHMLSREIKNVEFEAIEIPSSGERLSKRYPDRRDCVAIYRKP